MLSPLPKSLTGLVIGFADAAELRLDDLARVLEAAPDARAAFHRAFDAVRDPLRAIDALAAIPQVDSIPREQCAPIAFGACASWRSPARSIEGRCSKTAHPIDPTSKIGPFWSIFPRHCAC